MICISTRAAFITQDFFADVYLRIVRALLSPETFVPPRESHEIFIKTKSVITTRIIPRRLDSREIATPLFHSTPGPTVSLSVLRETT